MEEIKNLGEAITDSHQKIKNYIDNRDEATAKEVQNSLKNDDDFISDLKTIVYKTITTDLEIDVNKNVIDIDVFQNNVDISIDGNLAKIEVKSD